MKTNQIPNEILHWSERAEFKAWKKEQRITLFENVIFVLLLVTLIALSFYAGRLVERHFTLNDSVKKAYYQKDKTKFIRI